MTDTDVVVTGPTNVDRADAERIFRGLTEWFGMPEAIERYLDRIESQPTFACSIDGEVVGVAMIENRYPTTAELSLLIVERKRHRRGIGRRLLSEIERALLRDGVSILYVKVLGPSRESREWEGTRRFYERCGFVPIEEFDGIWNRENPCLILVRSLESISSAHSRLRASPHP